MARKLRIAAIVVLVLLAAGAAALWGLYRATQHVRPFYRQAMTLDRQTLDEGSRVMESRATALYSDAQKPGRWQALFTADQINGWLAVKLAEDFKDAVSDDVRDPRVAVSPDAVTLGFRTKQGGVDTVVSVDAAVFLTESGAVAIRMLKVRAGALPLPVMQVADEVAAACRDMSLPVRWTQQEGQPVAIIDLGNVKPDAKQRLSIDTVELRDGELYVAGRTEEITLPNATTEEAADR